MKQLTSVTLTAGLLLLSALGAQAQTCTRWVDYPMTIDYHTPKAVAATEFGWASGHARFGAKLVIDEAIKADLDASLAAGCRQELRNFASDTRLFTAGYCQASFSGSTQLDGYRPTTGRLWNMAYWSQDDQVGKFGGEIAHTHPHETAAPAKRASRARVGDEVWVQTSANLDVFCFGNPDSIADRGEASYDWGATPAPVVRIWLP